jgi:hypothetical protein
MCNEGDVGGVEVTIVGGRVLTEDRSLADTHTTTGMVVPAMEMAGPATVMGARATELDPNCIPIATAGGEEVPGGESLIILLTRQEEVALEGIVACLRAGLLEVEGMHMGRDEQASSEQVNSHCIMILGGYLL